MKKLFPITITKELVNTKDFYVNYFGFEVVFEAEWYIHLRHQSGIELAVMIPDLDNQPDFLRSAYAGVGAVYSFEVDDAEAEYQRLKEMRAPIVFDMKDEEWGQRHFMLKDPSGMIVDVVQHL